ncbi:N-acetylmannosamine-6-phosphate 2-epimerase [Ferdinandcohnia quinoae]|uniref:Putative N-acetylmannosamine-6-phosphate 2-epimerase n=1 Tax=Fredinandcohnia quinoae TaxID=2918902 RepID=A0AAW5E6U0_9BACI|nr:N-acetylmannosamine-6-phosphate 2-epimerase [Fredinandcohnia sp. SECRCQ15]MCH1624504.1 N-acetylmannosamine-6-phosphate 2-epimerase [Fredinandcohnia sp. SECRCQ15]
MAKNRDFFEKVNRKLIVSCQALPDEPLHSPFIMSKMALAVVEAGASGIRANSVEDINEIKKVTNLPIIGIIKQEYKDSDVFITPTLNEIELLINEGVDMIALDATGRVRPDGTTISEIFPMIREKYPDQLFMADCSTLDEGIKAEKLGFDAIGTTLAGYTSYTKDVELPNFELIKQFVDTLKVPVIAEGGISTPEELKKVFDTGVHSAVVGSAITRPREITKRFLQAIQD